MQAFVQSTRGKWPAIPLSVLLFGARWQQSAECIPAKPSLQTLGLSEGPGKEDLPTHLVSHEPTNAIGGERHCVFDCPRFPGDMHRISRIHMVP